MKRKTLVSMVGLATLFVVDAAVLNVAQAWNMGNMMNPSRWFDDDDDYYRGYRYGGYGPYGYGGGPWGYGGPYGYGGGPYGYGWGGYPGYGGGYPSTIVVNPSGNTNRAPAPAPAPRLPE